MTRLSKRLVIEACVDVVNLTSPYLAGAAMLWLLLLGPEGHHNLALDGESRGCNSNPE